MATGLVFCGFGDLFYHMKLHPKHGGDLWFLIGLMFFFIGHILFMFSMSKRSYAIKEKSGMSQDDTVQKIGVTSFIFLMVTLMVPAI